MLQLQMEDLCESEINFYCVSPLEFWQCLVYSRNRGPAELAYSGLGTKWQEIPLEREAEAGSGRTVSTM